MHGSSGTLSPHVPWRPMHFFPRILLKLTHQTTLFEFFFQFLTSKLVCLGFVLFCFLSCFFSSHGLLVLFIRSHVCCPHLLHKRHPQLLYASLFYPPTRFFLRGEATKFIGVHESWWGWGGRKAYCPIFTKRTLHLTKTGACLR